MNQNQVKLDFILNVDEFQKIQNDIANATNFSVLTVDYKGIPVTQHSQCSDFCKTVRRHSVYAKLCEKCDSRGGIEAARIQKPYIYLCHFGLIDFAVPIIINDHYLGAIMAGQVILKKADHESIVNPLQSSETTKENTNVNADKNKDIDDEIECIVNVQYKFIELELENELSQLRKKLPVVTLEQVRSVSNLMQYVSNFIVKEARNNLLAHNEKNQPKVEADVQATHHEALLGFQSNNAVLKPGLDYIYSHYGENITLEDVATVCNISKTYFSRLFKRETGLSFPMFINELRIDKAKDLLVKTDRPIMTISSDIGFEECAYFIRVFKKIVNMTPASYRKKFMHK